MSSKGTRGAKAALKAIDGGLKGVPKPPAEIPAVMHGEWNVVAAEMVKREILAPSMHGILITYFIALWTCREAQKAIEEHGLMVHSAHEKLKPNPACGILSRSQETVARMAAELGLTPAARSKQGFQPKGGQAHEGAPAGLDL